MIRLNKSLTITVLTLEVFQKDLSVHSRKLIKAKADYVASLSSMYVLPIVVADLLYVVLVKYCDLNHRLSQSIFNYIKIYFDQATRRVLKCGLVDLLF